MHNDFTVQSEIDKYIKSLGDIKRISREREKELSSIIANSIGKTRDSAIKELVEANLPLVINIAMKRKNWTPDIMDLIYEGNVALIRAAELYDGDHDSNANFATFAYIAISNAMNDVDANKTIYLPRIFYNYYKIIKNFEEANGKKASLKDIAKLCNVGIRRAKNIRLGLSINTSSLENMVEDGHQWDDILGEEDPRINNRFLRLDLLKFVSELKPQHQEIVRLMYEVGLDGAETARKLGYTRQYIDIANRRIMREIRVKIMKSWDKDNKTKTKIMHGDFVDNLKSIGKRKIFNKLIVDEEKSNKKIYKEVISRYLGKS